MATQGAELAGKILIPREQIAYVIMTSAGAGGADLRELQINEVICYPLPRGPALDQPANDAPAVPGLMAAPPILSSRPTASAVLYLDFDGAVVTDPDWPAYASDGVTVTGPTIVAAPSPLTNTQITEV